jgi:serine/threonine protein kinase
MPPFVVMEKGESLSDWTDRARPELFQGIAVLVHVATRLRDMHAAGYVHRDIKPGNIMLLPRKNSWTVIDFGCTARTGELAPLSFTMQYCPPEVIEAYLAKEKYIVAAEAVDAWAMGVVAFELLTGGNAFSFVRGTQQVCDAGSLFCAHAVHFECMILRVIHIFPKHFTIGRLVHCSVA